MDTMVVVSLVPGLLSIQRSSFVAACSHVKIEQLQFVVTERRNQTMKIVTFLYSPRTSFCTSQTIK